MIQFTQSQFSYIGERIAYQQDKGLRLSVDELTNLVEGRKLIPWIELNVCSVDFWDDDAKKVMEVEFESIFNCYTFGIETDGLARLMAYCFSFMDNLPTRSIEDL